MNIIADPNPFLDAINSVPDAGSTGNLPSNFSFSTMPSIHGVDLSSVPVPNWNQTPSDFAPGWGTSSSEVSNSAVPSLIAQSQRPGFWGTIGNAIGNAWHTTTTDIGGLLRGIANPALSRQADLERQFGPLTSDNPNVVLGPHGLMYKNQPSSWTNPFVGIAQAAQNPAQSIQQFNQNLNQSVTGMNPFEATMIRAGLSTPLSATTYLPVGTLAKVSGVTPAMKFGYDWLKGAVKGLPDTASVLSDITKGAEDAAKTKAPLPFAPEINDWAGIKPGAGALKVPTEVQFPMANIAQRGAFKLPQSVANATLENLFNTARQIGLPTGRETETLQDLLGSLSGRSGVSLDNLINQASTLRDVSPLIDRANAMRTAGITAQDIAPQAFKTGAKTVMREVPQGVDSIPNFTMRNALPPMVIPQAVKDIAQNAVSATGKGPYAAFNWQSALGKPFAEALANMVPNGVPGIRNLINGGEKLSEELFKPLGGARSYFVNAVGKMFGANQSDRNALKLALQNVGKNVSPEQAIALTHALEPTAFGTKLNDSALEAIRQQIDPIREGINNRAATMLNNQLDTNAMGVGQHISHVRTDKFAEDGQPIVDGAKLLKTTFDSANARGIPGTIKDINTNPDLPNFEENLFKILAHHGDQVNRAANARALINEAMDHGLPIDGKISENEVFPGTHQKAKTFTFGDKSVLLPESETKFLKGIIDPESESTISKLYRGGVNAANRVMFLGSPLIHILNNLGWQTASHAPDIFGRMMNRDLWRQAFTNVRPGSTMDQALQNGALHLSSEIGQRGNTKQFVSDVMNGINNPKSSNPLAAIAKSYLNLTPNVEKIYRTAAFQHALDQGMAPEDATQWVRNIFGGNAPGTASKAETALTSVMPFFNWTKTAIGSNVKNALRNPAPYSAALNLMDAINQQNTGGQHFWQNKNPLSIELGTTNDKGNAEFWTPYFPALEPLKIANDINQNGIWSGPANFAFGRFNPIAKFLTQMATKELNPAGLPPNKRSTMPSPDLPTNSTFNTEPLFGDKGPMVPFAVSQLMQDIPNPLESIQRMSDESTPAKLLTNPFASLSGTISAPNVASDAKHAKYFQGQQGGEIRNWLKKFAQQAQTQ